MVSAQTPARSRRPLLLRIFHLGQIIPISEKQQIGVGMPSSTFNARLRHEMCLTHDNPSRRYKDALVVQGRISSRTGSPPMRARRSQTTTPRQSYPCGAYCQGAFVMPVATPRHHHAPGMPEGQPSPVHKYGAPWRKAEHQTFHQSGDVFRHRAIHVDAHTTSCCVVTHSVSPDRDVARASQPEC
jgi:hypothetical protein